jgi:signal-transduction protein with cAMP-binding, CBS, and nucleotidyltransferase domain
MLTIKHVLESKDKLLWSIDPKSKAYEALEIMAEKDIGALLVIESGKLVGLFSERDYARKVILKGKSSKETSVEELMTREIYSITPDKSVEECLALLTAAHCRHMPVMENDQLIGLVTIGDVVNALITDKQITIDDLKNYIAGSEYIEVADNP